MKVIAIVGVIVLVSLLILIGAVVDPKGEHVVSEYCRTTSEEWREVRTFEERTEQDVQAKHQLRDRYYACLARPSIRGL